MMDLSIATWGPPAGVVLLGAVVGLALALRKTLLASRSNNSFGTHGQLQGVWRTTDGVIACVDGERCTFSSGETLRVEKQDGATTMDGWTLVSGGGPVLSWTRAGSEVGWRRCEGSFARSVMWPRLV